MFQKSSETFDSVEPVINTGNNKGSLHDQSSSLVVRAKWLYEPDEADRLNGSHFRRVLKCSCGKLERSVEHNYIELYIEGESFMLHQVSSIIVLTFILKELICHSKINVHSSAKVDTSMNMIGLVFYFYLYA
jgi:tRNA pseudouridine38-40 synthase